MLRSLVHGSRDLLPRRRFDPLALMPLVAAIVAAVSLTQPVPWGIACFAALGAAGVSLLVWHRPGMAAGLIPALLVPPQFLKVFAYELALLVTFGLVLVAGIRAKRPWVWSLDHIEVALVGCVAWGVVTVFWSPSLWWWSFAVRKYGMGVIALWTAWRLARNPHFTWDLMRGLAFGSIALAATTLAKASSSGLLALGKKISRNTGTDLGWGTSNYIGAILVLMLPTALHLALHGPDRRTRALGWIALPFSALVMSIAASRGGALLMVGVALFYIFRERIGKQTLVLLLGLASVIGLLVAGPGSSLFVSRFTDPKELGSVIVRLFLLREGWRRVLEYLPFGMGMGQGVAAPDYLARSSPHNFFITLGYEVGLLGVALWVLVLVLLARRGWKHSRDPVRGRVAHAMLFTLFTAVVNSVFEPTFEGLHFQFLFFWIMGIYLGTLSLEPEAGTATAGPRVGASPSRESNALGAEASPAG
jgi:O-antigen ligase